MCATPLDNQTTIIIIIYSTVVDILIDLMIIAMPLKLLYRVQISFRQKMALSGVFSMGTVIVIFSIIRAIQVTTTARNDTFFVGSVVDVFCDDAAVADTQVEEHGGEGFAEFVARDERPDEPVYGNGREDSGDEGDGAGVDQALIDMLGAEAVEMLIEKGAIDGMCIDPFSPHPNPLPMGEGADRVMLGNIV